MKVCNFFINSYQQKPSFKSEDRYAWKRFGYDPSGEDTRNYIRAWREKEYFPHQKIYEKEGRLSEYCLNTLIKSLGGESIQRSTKMDEELIPEVQQEDPNIENVGEPEKKFDAIVLSKMIKNFQFLGDNNSCRGAMIKSDEFYKLEKLKECGINQIVDLYHIKDLESESKKIGIDYMHIQLSDNDYIPVGFMSESRIWYNTKYDEMYKNGKSEEVANKIADQTVNSWKIECREFIDKFTTFIQVMGKERVFVGCEFGKAKTDKACFFDYMFNPKANHDKFMSRGQSRYIGYAENLYHNLTDLDKKKMGWPEGYDERFLEKIEEMKSRYCDVSNDEIIKDLEELREQQPENYDEITALIEGLKNSK